MNKLNQGKKTPDLNKKRKLDAASGTKSKRLKAEKDFKQQPSENTVHIAGDDDGALITGQITVKPEERSVHGIGRDYMVALRHLKLHIEEERLVKQISGRSIRLVGSKEEQGTLIASRVDNSEMCLLILTFQGMSVQGIAADYFEAFCQIRLRLEEVQLIPYCYGASLDVYPTAMSREKVAA
jgi:hypothetical protein